MSKADSRPIVLIVDDDVELVDMLLEYLGGEGFNCIATHDSDKGAEILATQAVDLMILDIMLPGRSGLDLLRQWAPVYPGVGVLMLTARGDSVDRILGLELGADDYLPKPFDPRELSARMRAILRRREPPASLAQSSAAEQAPPLVLGSLALDTSHKQLQINGRPLPLTAAEYRVLRCLLQSAGKPVDRETLTEYALGRKLTPYDRSIDTHISNLRRKLEGVGVLDVTIHAIRGTGYEIVGHR